MFNTAKSLIVVYKDEISLNLLKKLIETKDDTESKVIGIPDGSVNVVAWTEKVWLANKKPGNLQGKVLFLDDIKGYDKLIPVIDIQFDKHGVKYGWAGNQAIIYTNVKELTDRDEYLAFVDELKELPIPDSYKEAKNVNIGNKEDVKDIESSEEESDSKSQQNVFLKAKGKLEKGVNSINNAGIDFAKKLEDSFRDKNYVKTQMLLYGIIHLYNDHLNEFMNK